MQDASIRLLGMVQDMACTWAFYPHEILTIFPLLICVSIFLYRTPLIVKIKHAIPISPTLIPHVPFLIWGRRCKTEIPDLYPGLEQWKFRHENSDDLGYPHDLGNLQVCSLHKVLWLKPKNTFWTFLDSGLRSKWGQTLLGYGLDVRRVSCRWSRSHGSVTWKPVTQRYPKPHVGCNSLRSLGFAAEFRSELIHWIYQPQYENCLSGITTDCMRFVRCCGFLKGQWWSLVESSPCQHFVILLLSWQVVTT